ncbi:MAG: hypothetical protein ACI8ZF_000719 [Candidatus Midichloriaceae bacterium]|jgi:hypothetical protein
MFLVICDVQRSSASFADTNFYTYNNCKYSPFGEEKFVLSSSNAPTESGLKSLLEQGIAGGLSSIGYKDTHTKMDKLRDMESIKYIALLEENKDGMLEAGEAKYVMFNERIYKESGEVFFNKVNTFPNNDFNDDILKINCNTWYNLEQEYMEEAMESIYKNEAQASGQTTGTWYQYTVDTVYDACSSATNHLFGGDANQDL